MKITYISNTDQSEKSGGGSGVNNATIAQLKRSFNLTIHPPINPVSDNIAKIKSFVLKELGLKRNYHFFSEKRLKLITNLFNINTKENVSDAVFFHGFTPWIKTLPNKPYFCFNDACFASYVDIYNNKSEFSSKDLNRICKQEANWLSNAKAVFFRSQWALDETKTHYNLNGSNFYNVGVGGFIDIPEKDIYNDGLNFLFISREFIPKGGLVVAKALKKVRSKHTNAQLNIVGQIPPDQILDQEGVEYKGFFNKSVPSEKLELLKIFSTSFALVHPTIKDTNTLVINELAYFGCPAIASNKFAIPEYLLDRKTGFLIDDPKDSDELAAKMCQLIEEMNQYKQMRINTRDNALTHNTWDKVGERITSIIKQS
ncbi:glycosyltransferase family 4 protein [Saccharicrinis aurantiacus]|uniref:glycosyltransferase family 4 protein n=1 Tax=Saccharicrinis aurantiacus TaxID=1849719 RepID=UPI00094F4D6C|nr:glycosyltransferase [Saccharicrinis aurantiacus]